MEEVKRLQPTFETLRRLYSVSGNQCAFTGCLKPMFNGEGNFTGQVCHIEAAMPGGERFNKNMSNEQRRSFENLMLMCYDHHIETNKVHKYSTQSLKRMKQQHEAIYSNIDQFVRSMQSKIDDVTKSHKTDQILSLSTLYETVFDEDYRNAEEVFADTQVFNDAITLLASLSPDARRVFSISLSRSKYELNYSGRETDNLLFDPDEIQRVTGLSVQDLRSILAEIERAGFICWDEDSNSGRLYPFFRFPDSETNFWELIKRFCSKNRLDISDMIDNMKFSILD